MSRRMSSLCTTAAMLLAAAALSAQDAAQTPAAKADKMDKKSVSFTGCVQAGSTAGIYQLTNAMPAMAGKTGSGAMERGNMDHQMSTLMLTGTDVDLAPHVGHKVTVTGTMSGHMKGKMGGDDKVDDKMKDDKDDKTKSEKMGMDHSAQGSFNVKSVTMVSSTCS